MPIVAWSGLLIGVPGLAALVVVSIVSHEWVALCSVSFGLVIDFWVLYILLHRPRPSPVSPTTVFRPFARLTPEQTWPMKDVDRIVTRIFTKDGAIPFVVGASGVGKSTLLNVIVREKVEAKEPRASYTVISSGYSDLVRKLRILLAECDQGRRNVIVLDQFERWLARVASKRPKERKAQQRALLKVLEQAAAQDGCKVVVGLRRESYFELSFLDGLVPSPDNVCKIEPPAFDDVDDPMRAAIRTSFIEVLGDDDDEVADKILEELSPAGRLSPLRAQIVGSVLERRVERGKAVDLAYFKGQLGGANGTVDAYFDEVLGGASRPDLCMKILYALSVKTRFGNGVALSMLVDSLYENTRAVRATLRYLVEQRLVTKHGSAVYEIAHDWLAYFFDAKSGSELNPVDRDNIQIYAATGGEHGGAVTSRNRHEAYQRRPFGAFVVTVLIAAMTLRFFYFGIDTTVIGPSLARPLVGELFDVAYLPILVPYAVWTCYVGLFYDRLLVHLSESRLERFFSVFIVLNLIVSVALGMVIPFAWLLGMATGGIVFGGRMLWLSRNSKISLAARKRLKEFAIPTLGNLGYLAVIGTIGLVLSFKYVTASDHSSVSAWILASVVSSVGASYWCLVLTPNHVTRNAISRMLGLIGRPGSVPNASLGD